MIDLFVEYKEGRITKIFASPARKHLQDIDDKCRNLSEERSKALYSSITKLIWIMKRVRPNLDTVVGHICTRVFKSDRDDWKILQRIIAFIKFTIEDTREIGDGNLIKIFTWISVACAVNPNTKSQTGGSISMGMSALYAKSGKQKLNVKGLT